MTHLQLLRRPGHEWSHGRPYYVPFVEVYYKSLGENPIL